jgi:hypothetical protein
MSQMHRDTHIIHTFVGFIRSHCLAQVNVPFVCNPSVTTRMAPKKANPNAAGKANAKAGGAPAAIVAAAPTLPNYHNPNVEWHHMLAQAIDTIKNKFGMDIDKADALAEGDGFTAPVNEQVLQDRLSDPTKWTGQIIASGGVNIFWANPLESLTPNVSINKKAVENYMKNYWQDGVVKPLDMPIDLRLDGKFPISRGSMMRLSPEEMQHALILKVAQRINAGANEAELLEWSRCMLSATGRFMRADTYDEQYFCVTNSRRRMRDAASAIVHLASQVVCDIWLFKARKEAQLNKTLSTTEIAKLYEDNMKDAKTDEESRCSSSTIEAAVVVYDKLFSHPDIRNIIETLESNMLAASPFNSITKLLEIYYKCKSTIKLEWFFRHSYLPYPTHPAIEQHLNIVCESCLRLILHAATRLHVFYIAFQTIAKLTCVAIV